MLTMILGELRKGKPQKDVLALCSQLVAETDALRLEVAKLRAENRSLRRRLADRELATVRRAEADALFVGALAYAQLPTSRRACQAYGLSRRRWAWAVALLRAAHVVTHDGEWLGVSVDGFEAALRAAVGRCEAGGVEVIASHLGRNGYGGRHKTHPRKASAAGPHPVTRPVTQGAQNVTTTRVNPLLARRQG